MLHFFFVPLCIFFFVNAQRQKWSSWLFKYNIFYNHHSCRFPLEFHYATPNSPTIVFYWSHLRWLKVVIKWVFESLLAGCLQYYHTIICCGDLLPTTWRTTKVFRRYSTKAHENSIEILAPLIQKVFIDLNIMCKHMHPHKVWDVSANKACRGCTD